MTRHGARLGMAVALLGLLALGPAGRADVEPGSGFASYSLRASAPGLAIEGLYKDVALTVPETTSTLSTGGVGSGLAALGWPGPIVGNAGTTILVLQPTAPSQVTMLNDPVQAQARTAGPQQATFDTVPGTVMSAGAKPDDVTASSQTGSGTVLPIGQVGVVSSSSEVALHGASTAVATSQSAVQNLALAGGAVQVGAVRSEAWATSDGQHASSKGSTTVTGLQVAGVPVAVDDKGIHVAGQQAANPVPTKTVADAVQALGLTILLTEPHEVRQAGSVQYAGAALVVMWSQAGQQYAVTIGRASVGIDAAPAPSTTAPGIANGDTTATATGPTAAAPAAAGLTSTESAPPSSGEMIGPVSVPAPVAAVVRALAPVALALAGGAPLPLALVLLVGGLLGALALGRLPARLFLPPAADCEDLS